MSSFTAELDVRITQKSREGRRLATLLSAFTYEVGELGSGELITVPAGFETDFASVPRLLWAVEPPLGDAGKAAVLHDWLYETGQRPRAEADRIFLEAMGVLEVSWLKRRLIYSAVRCSAEAAIRNAAPRPLRPKLQPPAVPPEGGRAGASPQARQGCAGDTAD